MGADARRPRDRPGAGGLVRGLDGAGPRGGARDARVRPGLRRRRHVRRRRRRRPGRRSRRCSACRTCRTPRGSSPTWRPDRPRPADQRRPATTSSRRRCPRVIGGTQALGEPRYPSLKGIMAARGPRRSSRGRSPTSGSTPATVGGAVATTAVARDARRRRPRGATRGRPRHARRGRRAGSSTSSPSGGSSDGRASGSSPSPARTAASPGISAEVATLARDAGRRPPAATSSGSWSPPTRRPRPRELAALPAASSGPSRDPAAADHAWSAVAARPRRRARRRPTRPTRSSSGPGPTAATSPARCRR